MSDRIRSLTLFTALLIATACGGGSDTPASSVSPTSAAGATAVTPSTPVTPMTPAAMCGNGKLETGEVCDGANLNGQSCMSMGLNPKGMLLCKSDCKAFDTLMCLSAAAAAPVGGAGSAQGGSGARTTGSAGAGGSGR